MHVGEIAAGLRIGLSTHNLAQVDRAIADQPDYVAFGPVFSTRSKTRPDDVVGLEALLAGGRALPHAARRDWGDQPRMRAGRRARHPSGSGHRGPPARRPWERLARHYRARARAARGAPAPSRGVASAAPL